MSTVTKSDPASPAGSANALSRRRPLGDRGFQILTLVAGLLVLIILALIAISMAQQSTTWFSTAGLKGIFSVDWDPATNNFGAMGFLYGTVICSVIALIIGIAVLDLGVQGLHISNQSAIYALAPEARSAATCGPMLTLVST